MRTNKIIDASVDEVESAKETAITLIQNNAPLDVMDLFYNDDLELIEKGIKELNDYSNKSWLLSSILLYTLIYNKGLYTQSGLTWAEYSMASRERLGLEQRDITEQLSAARFFIVNHEELERRGFNPIGNNRKLARAELATELSGDVHEVITHLISDTWADYYDWYTSFKTKKALPEIKREDIQVKNNKFYIGEKEAIKISSDIQEQDKTRLEKYITEIFEILQSGNEPAIISVYDDKEARALNKLRDKYRQKK
jgi:hypothetical protein